MSSKVIKIITDFVPILKDYKLIFHVLRDTYDAVHNHNSVLDYPMYNIENFMSIYQLDGKYIVTNFLFDDETGPLDMEENNETVFDDLSTMFEWLNKHRLDDFTDDYLVVRM